MNRPLPDVATEAAPEEAAVWSEAPDEPTGDRARTSNEVRRRPRRRAVTTAGLVAVLAIAGGAIVTRGGRDGQGGAGGATATTAGLATATVERRDLEEHAELDGTLGYGDVADVTLPGGGTITGLAPIGTIVDRGQTLVEVEGRPVPLLFGDRPLWRELGPGVDDGADVQQLEANLVALGIVTEAELTVDQDWTSATTDAVQEWQETSGLDDTGVIRPGDAILLHGAVRVAEHPTPLGGAAGGPVLGITSSTRQVTVDLEATRQGLLQADQAVDIELPDGMEAPGTVRSVGNVATGGTRAEDQGGEASGGDGDEEATIEVVITLDDPAAGTNLDQAPVTVRVVTSAAEGVLAVSVEALLALAEGGYAVEVVQDGATTRLVGVELGAFAEGWVEVTGDLAEGDEVVVPSE